MSRAGVRRERAGPNRRRATSEEHEPSKPQGGVENAPTLRVTQQQTNPLPTHTHPFFRGGEAGDADDADAAARKAALAGVLARIELCNDEIRLTYRRAITRPIALPIERSRRKPEQTAIFHALGYGTESRARTHPAHEAEKGVGGTAKPNTPRTNLVASRAEDRERDREVEARAFLAQLRRRQVDRDLTVRPGKRGRGHTAADSMLRLLDRPVDEPDDRERRQAAAEVALHLDAPRLQSHQRVGDCACEHTGTLRGEVATPYSSSSSPARIEILSRPRRGSATAPESSGRLGGPGCGVRSRSSCQGPLKPRVGKASRGRRSRFSRIVRRSRR